MDAHHVSNDGKTTGRCDHNQAQDLSAVFKCPHAVDEDRLVGQLCELFVAAVALALPAGEDQAVALSGRDAGATG